MVLLFEVTVVEREVRFGSFVTTLEELRPDVVVASLLKEVLRPVELVTELLRLEDALLDTVELRPLIADDEA